MNSVFTLSARLKGVVEERETGISEVIFKNSGLVAPTALLSNQIQERFKKIYELRAFVPVVELIPDRKKNYNLQAV